MVPRLSDLTVNLVVADSGLGFPRTWVAQPVAITMTVAGPGGDVDVVGIGPTVIGTGPDPWAALFDLLAQLLSDQS